ncbi:hypothetical protein Csa_018885 [Cucumis sativus]|nr:hypothetical protein Csa_018885 [Cucumis sativus]
MLSHKTFRMKKKLAKKKRHNRPNPHWIRLRIDNTIDPLLVSHKARVLRGNRKSIKNSSHHIKWDHILKPTCLITDCFSWYLALNFSFLDARASSKYNLL